MRGVVGLVVAVALVGLVGFGVWAAFASQANKKPPVVVYLDGDRICVDQLSGQAGQTVERTVCK